MRRKTWLLIGLGVLAFAVSGLKLHAADAKINLPLLGVWDEFNSTTADGKTETNHAGMRRIFTPWGFYSITLAAEGRNKVKKRIPEMTKEELLNRFTNMITQDGTFEATGPDRITLHRRVSESPENHGTQQLMEWKIENGDLSLKIISDTGGAPVGQITRYHRMN